MTDFAIAPGPDGLRLCPPEGETLVFPWLWLRDNEPEAFHTVTRERRFDLLSVPADLRPESAELQDGAVLVRWPDLPEPRRYPLDWLLSRAPGRRRPDPADIAPAAWQDRHALAAFDGNALGSDEALGDMLVRLKRDGLIVVRNLTGEEDGIELGRRIGFLRETNFGVIFEVVSLPEPNNQAYTADDLPLHTDLPNQHLVPGYQFLHCLANGAAGGDSVFADGFRILSDLQAAEPEAYRLLTEVEAPFRFRDRDTDLRIRRPLVELDAAGRPARLAFNSGILDIVDMDPAIVSDWYRAYRSLMAAVAGHPCRLQLRLEPGDMAVFDNSRVLHGRTAFDPASGQRRLRGFYIDRGEMDSRLRVLRNAQFE